MQTKEQNPNGLYAKYSIRKITGWKRKNEFSDYKPVTKPVEANAEYFVLRLDENSADTAHTKACRKAIHTYAEAMQGHIPQLAKDLKEKYPLIN